MKASWSSDQSFWIILICPSRLSQIQPAITWTWILAHWAPKLHKTVGSVLQQHRSFSFWGPMKTPPAPQSNTLTAPLKHLRLQSDILCQSWVSLGLLALGHWIGGNWAGVGKGGLTLDCVYHPLQILPIKHMDCVTASLANAWLQKPNKSPRLLSQSRPVNVDHTVRAQPQIKTKGEICSASHCLLEFFAYFEWRSVDFIHSSARIHVICKGGISEEMYQFSMLRTSFSVCIRAIDRNPLSLPEGKKSQCFYTPLVRKGW